MADSLCLRRTVVPPSCMAVHPGVRGVDTLQHVSEASPPIASRDAAECAEVDALRIPIGTRLDDAERALILATLSAASGSKVKAAQSLGISLKTLYNRLHAYRDAAAGAGKRPTKRPTVPLPLSEAA